MGMSAEERAIKYCDLAHPLKSLDMIELHKEGICCSECVLIAEVIKEAEAAARADERVKVWNEGIMECVKDDTREAAILADLFPTCADAVRSSAYRHERHLKVVEAQPVEPSEGEG